VADAGVLSPDAAFDRQWALTVVARALASLRGECVAEGRLDFFEQVKPWLMGDAAHGDQAALAAACGLNPNALKVAVHRLKRRFRQLLKAEVAGTLDDPALVEAEMRDLFAALGG
jgi:RNA polymerase sigma-70 factor (ECF subfamily)